MFVGLVLVAIGAIALLVQLGVLPGSIWSYAWPVILIIIGLAFIIRRRRCWTSCRQPREDDDKTQNS